VVWFVASCNSRWVLIVALSFHCPIPLSPLKMLSHFIIRTWIEEEKRQGGKLKEKKYYIIKNEIKYETICTPESISKLGFNPRWAQSLSLALIYSRPPAPDELGILMSEKNLTLLMTQTMEEKREDPLTDNRLFAWWVAGGTCSICRQGKPLLQLDGS
jgi:hypothetical protein